MISCEELFSIFQNLNLKFYSGVPDSCFAPIVDYLLAHEDDYHHIIATNEGEALAIATGYHLSTGGIPVLYVENAGLGNLINPLTSLTDKYVYNIPTLLLISWRGAPSLNDAPQHNRMGIITPNLLELLGIPYYVYGGDNTALKKMIYEGLERIKEKNVPYALLFAKGDIQPYSHMLDGPTAEMTREEAIKIIADEMNDSSAVFLSTTGKTSRELFEYREVKGVSHEKDFLNVGAMGYVSSVGFGLSLNTRKKVVVLDGDASILMHMGNLATIGHHKPDNFYHVILDNHSHDSTGGQPTVADTVDFCEVARAVGYRYAKQVETAAQLKAELKNVKGVNGPALLLVYVKKGARDNLGRPTIPLTKLKESFMKSIE